MQINFKEHNKLRIRSYDPEFFKHESVKLLVMLISNFKHRGENIPVYSEYEMYDGTFPDVIVELKDGFILYEIQKEISPRWLERIEQRNKDAPIKLLKKVDTVIIPLKELSDNLNTLVTELDRFVV